MAPLRAILLLERGGLRLWRLASAEGADTFGIEDGDESLWHGADEIQARAIFEVQATLAMEQHLAAADLSAEDAQDDV